MAPEEEGSSLQSIEEHLVEAYRQSTDFRETQQELQRINHGRATVKTTKGRTVTYNTSFGHQFKWVLWRTFKNLMLNPQTSFAQVINFTFCEPAVTGS